MAHELVSAFERHNIALTRHLVDMLNDTPQHCTDRRGCGLTQSTRLLADFINCERLPNDPCDLSIFGQFASTPVTALANHLIEQGWTKGWRELHRAPPELLDTLKHHTEAQAILALYHALDSLPTHLEREESLLVLSLLNGILSAGANHHPTLPFMPDKPDIGSCSQAEEFFLEIAHGKIRRGGHVNIIVDADQTPLLIEKMNLGESYSSIFLKPLIIGGVLLPAGSLAALSHQTDPAPPTNKAKHQLVPLDSIKQARFLRITTLAVTPQNRERAFSTQFKRQQMLNMLSPATTTLDDLRHFAHDCTRHR